MRGPNRRTEHLALGIRHRSAGDAAVGPGDLDLPVSQTPSPSLESFERRDRYATPSDPLRRLLVVAPHPDDDVLAVGGTMAQARARGGSVLVAYLTNGDANRAARRIATTRPLESASQYRSLGAKRQAEAILALRRLGLPASSAVFLNYPDRGLMPCLRTHWNSSDPYRSRFTDRAATYSASAYMPNAPYCGENLVKDIASILLGFRPTCVYLPHESDAHPDHRAAYSLGMQALRAAAGEFFPATACRTRCYPVHGFQRRPRLVDREAHSPRLVPLPLPGGEDDWCVTLLSGRTIAAKYAAIRSHRSQWLVTRHFLASFATRCEIYAPVTARGVPAASVATDCLGGDVRKSPRD